VSRIRLFETAKNRLIEHSQKGYEAPYKKEVGGHLLGHYKNNIYSIYVAEPYNTHKRTRTSFVYDDYNFEKKARKLESELRLKWIGIYHSHNEINRRASTKQSSEDRETQIDSKAPIELIIRVSNYGMNWPRGCLAYKIPFKGYLYYFDICGYLRDMRGSIKKIKIVEAKKD
jgi:proteasome lid subunit RPN8/RPN11